MLRFCVQTNKRQTFEDGVDPNKNSPLKIQGRGFFLSLWGHLFCHRGEEWCQKAPQKCSTLTVKTKNTKQRGDQSSGEGPCSVVSTSQTLTDSPWFSHVQACTHSIHTHSQTRTQTQILWLRQWWQTRLQWGRGSESEDRRSGLMAVKAPANESKLLILLTRFPRPSLSRTPLCRSLERHQVGWHLWEDWRVSQGG